MKCASITTQGSSCSANAIHNGKYCYRHAPEKHTEALEASKRGGYGNRQYHQIGDSLNLETPEDIKKLMAKAINSLWTGKMSSNNPAGALGYMAKIFLEAYEKSEIEKRIELLEERLNKAMVNKNL